VGVTQLEESGEEGVVVRRSSSYLEFRRRRGFVVRASGFEPLTLLCLRLGAQDQNETTMDTCSLCTSCRAVSILALSARMIARNRAS